MAPAGRGGETGVMNLQKSMPFENERLADARDMFAVHTMFRREFGLMSSLVRKVQDGDVGRTIDVTNHVEFICDVLHFHHKGEDTHIWPALLARGDDEVIAIVEDMEADHHRIAACLIHLMRAVDSWRAGSGVAARDALGRSIDRLIPILDNHLSNEERRAVPLIERYVTEAEYALVVEDAAKEMQPDKLAIVCGMVFYEASPDVIDAIVARFPPDVPPQIKELAANAYAAYAKDLYGTPTPPKVSEG